ncbi:hypothetical protein GCM10023187_36290 [Nibrella viscosa]|uniref:Gliding motility-associated C-terminal domain-containing protein n=1 Tax=Nibrella viscosa TaxID=1084524 RepID=A0ABP8KP21_9BACT
MYLPQINESRIVSETGRWHKVSGCFQAKEAYQFLTIGNFFSDQQTSYIEVDRRGRGAYYFIDDVLVTETNLTNYPLFSLRDTILCPARSIDLSLPDDSQTQYRWQDGSTAPTYTIRQAGLYSVTATSGLCTLTDSFRVAQEVTLRLPADTTLCRGIPFAITPTSAPNTTLLWSNGFQGSTLSVAESGLYWVRSESAACRQADSIRIRVVDCPGNIPNVFTPNSDGVNETFFIEGISLLPWRLEVFNRWGGRVYRSEAYRNEWTGDDLPAGTYYYVLSSAQIDRQYKGWVQLIR